MNMEAARGPLVADNRPEPQRDLNRHLAAMLSDIALSMAQQNSNRSVFEEVNYLKFGLTFLISLTLILIAWAIFEVMAQHPTTRAFARQRLFHPKCLAATKSGEDHRDPPPDVKALNSVLLGAFTIPDDKLSGLMGPGGSLTYRMIRYCVYFGNLSLVYVLTVLVPLYLSQYHTPSENATDHLLGMTSINFISSRNPSHMWVVVISAYLVCFFWVVVIFTEWQHVKAVRLSWEHDSRSYDVQSHYSLLVERNAQSRRLKELKMHLVKVLGKDESEISVVMPVYYNARLHELQTRRLWAYLTPSICYRGGAKDELLNKYDAQIYHQRILLRQEISQFGVSSIMQPGGTSVQRLSQRYSTSTHRSWSLIDENLPEGTLSQITVKSARSFGSSLKRIFIASHCPAYFVTMCTMRSRTVLSHMYSSQGDTFARITPAPAPRDIIWSNVTIEREVISIRKTFVNILFVFVILTYSIPLNLLLERSRKYRQESDVAESPDRWVKQMLYLFFPAIVQTVISQMMPRLLRLVSHKYERFKTYPEVTRHVMQRTFILQLLTIYIIVYGELWFDARNLRRGFIAFLDSTIHGFRQLGRAMPPVAMYFTSSVVINMVMEIAHPLIKPVDLIIVLWDRYVSRNLKAWDECPLFQMRYTGTMITYLTLLNTMFTFAVISPLVVFFCWIFWCLSYVWNTYSLIYLNNRRNEIGTSYSPTMYSAISFSLILSQLSVYLVIWSQSRAMFNKQTHPQLYVIAALVILLTFFKYGTMRNFNFKSNQFTSLSISADIDSAHKPEEISALFNPEYYMQPEAKLVEESPDEYGTGTGPIPEGTSESETAILIQNHIS